MPIRHVEIPYPGTIGHGNADFPLMGLNQLAGIGYYTNTNERNNCPSEKRQTPFKASVIHFDPNDDNATTGGEAVWMNYNGPNVSDLEWTNTSNWSLESSEAVAWERVGTTSLTFYDNTVPNPNDNNADYTLTHGTDIEAERYGAWGIGFTVTLNGVYSFGMGQDINETLPTTTALGQNLLFGAEIRAEDVSENFILGSFLDVKGDQLADTDNRGRGNVVVGVGGNAANPLVVTGQEQTVFHNISGNYTGQGIRGITNTVIGGKDHIVEASSDPLSEDTRENIIAAGNSSTIGQDTQRSGIIAGIRSSILDASRTSAIVCSEDSTITGSNFSGIYSGFRNTMALSANTSIVSSQDSDINEVTYGLITNSLNCDITSSNEVSIIGSNGINVTSLDRIVVLGLNGSSLPPGALNTNNTTYTDWLWVNGLITTHAYADDAAAGAAGLTAGKLYRTDGTGSAPLNVSGIVMVKL